MSLFAAKGLKVSLDPHRQLSFDLELEVGDVMQLLGPSGSGKTTILRTLARLRAPDTGRLLLEDTPADEISPARWRRRVAYLPQRPVMLSGTVATNLAAGFIGRQARLRFERPSAAALLARLGLDEELLDRDAALLSGGEAARVALCRALLLAPRVLLCDELTAGLDSESAASTVALVAEEMKAGATIIVAHDSGSWRGDALLGPRLRQQQLEITP